MISQLFMDLSDSLNHSKYQIANQQTFQFCHFELRSSPELHSLRPNSGTPIPIPLPYHSHKNPLKYRNCMGSLWEEVLLLGGPWRDPWSKAPSKTEFPPRSHWFPVNLDDPQLPRCLGKRPRDMPPSKTNQSTNKRLVWLLGWGWW